MGSIRPRLLTLATVGILGLGPTTASSSSESPQGDPAHPAARGALFLDPVAAVAWHSARFAGLPQAQVEPGPFEFTLARAAYSGGGWGRRRRGAWATDYPKADRQFLMLIRRLVQLDADPRDHAVRLDDPELRRYPFLYAVEVGYMDLTEPEVQGLRDYLLAGGFLVVDDFWGSREWWNFERQIRRVLPEYPIVDIPLDHPIFTSYYPVEEILQVPSINNVMWGRTWERDGYVPMTRGIFDEKGRLMVVINWNTDLGDAWEWAEDPRYPLQYSTYAYEMGANFIIYAMSH